MSEEIAKANNCQLTVGVESSKPSELTITINNSYEDLLLPGKVIYDFHGEIASSESKFSTFRVVDENGEIYSLTGMQLSNVARRDWHGKSIISKLNKTDFSGVYSQLSPDTQEVMSQDVFEEEMSKFEFNSMSFSGFKIKDSYLILGFDNDKNRLQLAYDFDSEDNSLLGIRIE